MCGHAAFVLTGLAFVTTDMLHLRLVALAGITSTMIFQYFRPQPLMLPLKWNAVFFSINVVMATLLIHERREANDMDDELVSMFQSGSFEPRGFNKVEFYRLFRLGKKEEKKQGDLLQQVGTSTATLCFIQKGGASIVRDGVVLTTVTENDFIGEVAFICALAHPVKNQTKNEEQEIVDETTNNNNSDNDLSMIAKEDVIVTTPTMTVWYWDIDDLKQMLQKPKNRGVANALLAYASHELREKLVDSWDIRLQQKREQDEMQQVAVNYLFIGALSKNDEKHFTSNKQ